MEARNERIDQLAERWLTAQATEEEERTLRELVRKGAALPEAFDDLDMLFEGFDDLAAETLPTERRSPCPHGAPCIASSSRGWLPQQRSPSEFSPGSSTANPTAMSTARRSIIKRWRSRRPSTSTDSPSSTTRSACWTACWRTPAPDRYRTTTSKHTERI